MDEQMFRALITKIESLEKRIERLENNAAPTIPIYDNTNWPQDAVEGQIAIAPN